MRITIKRRGRKAKTIRRQVQGRARTPSRFRRLGRGRYRVSVVAKDAAGNKSRPRSVRLKVRR